MSADLLRRAAALLRERGNAVTDADMQGMTWASAMQDGWLGGPAGDLCAVLSPPVALALADWLDWVEQRWRPESEVKHYLLRGELQDHALAVARAILREEA